MMNCLNGKCRGVPQGSILGPSTVQYIMLILGGIMGIATHSEKEEILN